MDNKNFIPKHKLIYDTIVQKIYDSEYMYGTRLPVMAELCQEYGVSPITIKTVITNLRRNGFVKTQQGSGVYVVWTQENRYFSTVSAKGENKITVTHSLLAPISGYGYLMWYLAKIFMQVNPHIEIKFINIDMLKEGDPYLQKIISDDLPCCGEFYWHAKYASLNALYPLDSFSDFGELAQDLHKQAFYYTTNSYKSSHIHAIHLYLGFPEFWMMNTDLYEQNSLPEKTSLNWDELHWNMRHLDKNLPLGYYSSAMNIPHGYHAVKFFIEMFGQDLFAQGRFIDSEEAFMQIFDTETPLYSLEELRRITANRRILKSKASEFFALGQVGMLPFSTQWTLQLILTMNAKMHYHACQMPPLGRNKYYHPFHSGFSVGIFRQGIKSQSQLQATWQWLRFLFCKQPQYLLSETLKMPVNKKVDAYLKTQHPYIDSLTNILRARSVPQPDFNGQRILFAAVGEKISYFLNSQQSPQQCLNAIKKALHDIRQK